MVYGLHKNIFTIQKWMMIYDDIEHQIITVFYVVNPLGSLANHIYDWLIIDVKMYKMSCNGTIIQL